MTVGKFNVEKTIETAQKLLDSEKNLSPALKAIMEVLIQLIILLCQRKTSANSHVPPSRDENRQRGSRRVPSGRKPGGQPGHPGTRLEPVENPDEICHHRVSECSHCGRNLRNKAAQREVTRQEFEIEVQVHVIEHRAEVKTCSHCEKETRAQFPAGVTQPVQYGSQVRALMVYLSQFQLIPYDRLQDLFWNFSLPLSKGTLANTVQLAYERLEKFERWAKAQLIHSFLIHADETGFYIEKKRYWLHCQTNDHVTLLYPHEKRGSAGVLASGVLSEFKGYLCHDDWKAYGQLEDCTHLCCNGHLIRELVGLEEEYPSLRWPKKMRLWLEKIHEQVTQAGGALDPPQVKRERRRLTRILQQAEKQSPCRPPKTKGRGRTAQGKARNLLERLKLHQASIVLYMENKDIPFTNNTAEQDIRMAKVQQKISGCFRSWEGAKAFCRIRSYLITARKNGQSPLDALECLFKGQSPPWMTELRFDHKLQES